VFFGNLVDMKTKIFKYAAIVLLLSGSFSSCYQEEPRKEEEPCVNRIIQDSPSTTVLSKSEIDEIKRLFNASQLDYKQYQFSQFQKDELDYKHVRCKQFINGLKILTSDLIFHFDKNDRYYSLSGRIVGKIDLDVIPSMNQDDVVQIYIDYVLNDQCRSDASKEEIINGCFDIEFGYAILYDYWSSNIFSKVWHISPKGSIYPTARINDDNAKLIMPVRSFNQISPI